MARAKPRTTRRQWGTRFDVIDTSSTYSTDDTKSTTADTNPVSHETSDTASVASDTSSTSHRAAAPTTPYRDIDEDAWKAPPNEASRGYAPGQASPTSHQSHSEGFKVRSWADSPPGPMKDNHRTPSTAPQYRGTPVRWSHDASVFVASLPPEPNFELDGHIRNTLGQHGNILNIKFIHDVRSGGSSNCAFVQFETPEQAQAAIQACHMTFIQGRCIRCEPARAHRALLISFCPSPEYPRSVRKGPNLQNNPRIGLDSPDQIPEWVRLRRPESGSRYVQTIFNQAALDYVDQGEPHWYDSSDPLQGAGALISLQSDISKGETMRTLAGLFGPLEMFKSFHIPSPGEIMGHPYAPHPPTPSNLAGDSDSLTWEIKWEQRNDALSALYTLGQFPNLIVTWAHEHPHPWNYRSRPFGGEGQQHQQQYPGNHQQHYIGNRGPGSGQPTTPVSSLSTPGIGAPDSVAIVANDRTPMNRPPLSRIVVSLPQVSSYNCREPAIPGPSPDDFPPLPGATEGGVASSPVAQPPRGSWKERVSLIPTDGSHPTEISQSHVDQSGSGNHFDTANASTEVVAPLSHRSSPSITDTSSGNALNHGGVQNTSSSVMLSPETPALLHYSSQEADSNAGSANATPVSTVSPITPSPMLRSRPIQPLQGHRQQQQYYQSQLSPDVLFVGSLDRDYGWTEDRLRNIFGRFGSEILNVKIIFKDNTDAAGHAFVKFADPSVLDKAIAAEHKKNYGDRAIRVKYSSPSYVKHRGPGSAVNRSGPTEGLGLQGLTAKSTDAADVFIASQSEYGLPIVREVDETGFSVISPEPQFAESAGVALSNSAPADLDHKSVSEFEYPAKDSENSSKVDSLKPSTPSHANEDDPLLSLTKSQASARKRHSRAKSDPAAAGSARDPSIVVPNEYQNPQLTSSESGYYYPYPPHMMYPTPPIEGTGPQHTSEMAWRNTFYSSIALPSMYPQHFAMYNNSSLNNPSPPSNTESPSPQAPLQATGFVQSETGMLIPVYKNDALDQYITASRTAQAPPFGQWADTSSSLPSFPPWLPQQSHQPNSYPLQYPLPTPSTDWEPSVFNQLHQTMNYGQFAPHAQHQHPYSVHPTSAMLPPFPGSNIGTTLPTPAPSHMRPGNNGTKSHARQLSRQSYRSSESQIQGPTLQQLMDNAKKPSNSGYPAAHSAHQRLISDPRVPTHPPPHIVPHFSPYFGYGPPSGPGIAYPLQFSSQASKPPTVPWNSLPAAYDNP